MSDGSIEGLKPTVRELLSIFEPLVEGACRFEWQLERDGICPVVILSVIRRQLDSLRAVLTLADCGLEDKGVALLRPACEELLWLKYLKSLKLEDREKLLRAKSQVEVQDTVTAQRENVGPDQMRAMGFPDWFVEVTARNAAAAQRDIDAFGRAFGWPSPKRGTQSLPSTWHLAKATGEEALYKLIFHATSRTVHFTVAELLRLAWGTSAETRISNSMMSTYWREFILYWGWRLFYFTLVEAAELLEGTLFPLAGMDAASEARFVELSMTFSKGGPVPIITPQEMNLHLSVRQKAGFFSPWKQRAGA